MASQLGTVAHSPHSSRTSMELFWSGCSTLGTQMLPAAGVIELQDTESQPAPATHSEARAAAAQRRRRMAAFSTPRRGPREGDIQTPFGRCGGAAQRERLLRRADEARLADGRGAGPPPKRVPEGAGATTDAPRG